jgi:PAS domain S-box-containing protein
VAMIRYTNRFAEDNPAFMNIDIRALSFITSLANVLQVLAIAFQYALNKKLPGVLWWLLGFTSIAVGCGLSLLREVTQDAPIVIIVSQTFFVLGLILLYVGIMRFLDKPEKGRLIIVVFVVYLPSFIYFTSMRNDINARILIMSFTVAILSFLMTHALFVYKTRTIRASANFNALVCFIFCCFFAFRAVAVATNYSTVTDYFVPTFIQISTFLASFTAGILLTFGLIIMVNQRLSEEIREAKEHFEVIFNTSPDSVLITRLSDGYYIDINEGFTALTGYTHTEGIGKTSLDLNIWYNPADRQKLISILAEKGSCDNMEAIFRRKDGSRLTGLVSARLITLDGVPHMISVTRDITDRKVAEQEREKLVLELRGALSQVKALSGLLPLCASCKKIKNDKGCWEQMEVYIRDHSEADFSHGICPDCIAKYYPDYHLGNE